jgi:FkbM family methyltransferase
VEEKYSGSAVIDFGANVGDTAAIVRGHSGMPILCVEGAGYYFELLTQNVGQLGAETEHCFVGSENGAVRGNLTIGNGTGFFRPDGDSEAAVRFETLDGILARYPQFQDARLLKVDTDGMDGRILAGALDWLARVQPVIFWEHVLDLDRLAGGPGLSIFERLREIGYEQVAIFDNRGGYVQTLPTSAGQQLADLSDYAPGAEAYWDICAFSGADLDLCDTVRRNELEARRERRQGRVLGTGG